MLKEKPTPRHHNKPALCYFECRDWLESKGIEHTNTFWHWFVEYYDFSNGSYVYLNVSKDDYLYDKSYPEIKKYLDGLREEFKEYLTEHGELFVYISW